MPTTDDSSQRRVVVIPTREVPLTRRERWGAFGMAVLTGIAHYLILWLLEWIGVETLELSVPIFLIAFLIWPTRVFRRHYVRLAPGDTIVPFLWYYSLGVGAAIYLRTIMRMLAGPFYRPTGVIEHAKILAFALLVILAFAAFAMFALITYWGLIRLTLPKFIKQDGTLCPNCAYCLLGVQSMRCPECGSAFTYDDLETTEAEFRAQFSAPGATTRCARLSGAIRSLEPRRPRIQTSQEIGHTLTPRADVVAPGASRPRVRQPSSVPAAARRVRTSCRTRRRRRRRRSRPAPG